MNDFCVKKGLGVGVYIINQRPDQILGFPAAGSDKNVIPTADLRKNRILIGEFLRVLFFPIVQRIHFLMKIHPGSSCREIWHEMKSPV